MTAGGVDVDQAVPFGWLRYQGPEQPMMSDHGPVCAGCGRPCEEYVCGPACEVRRRLQLAEISRLTADLPPIATLRATLDAAPAAVVCA